MGLGDGLGTGIGDGSGEGKDLPIDLEKRDPNEINDHLKVCQCISPFFKPFSIKSWKLIRQI
jgi:hypothetical protein